MHPDRLKVLITAILTTLVLGIVFADQQISVERTLNWSDKARTFSLGPSGSYASLQFQGASYRQDADGILPLYGESFPLQAAGRVTVQLEDAVFETVRRDLLSENDMMKGITLPDKIDIQNSIGYVRKMPVLDLSFVPLRRNPVNGQVEKLVSFRLVITVRTDRSGTLKETQTEEDYAGHSMLASGTWYKISTTKEGIYKIDRSMLNSIGMTGTVAFGSFGIFGNGGGMLPEANSAFRYDDLMEDPFYRYDANGNGLFDDGDYVLFYAQAPHRWYYDPDSHTYTHHNDIYSDVTNYFLTPDRGTGKQVPDQAQSPLASTAETSAFDGLTFVDEDKTNLIKSGRIWYGDALTAYEPSKSYAFSLPGLITSQPVHFLASAAANSVSGSVLLTFSAPGLSQTMSISAVGDGGFDETFANVQYLDNTFYTTTANPTVTVTFSGSLDATAWLDYIELQARQTLSYNNAQLYFRDAQTLGDGAVTTYDISGPSDLMIWEVTDPVRVSNQLYTFSGNISFRQSSDSLRQYIAFHPDDAFTDITGDGRISNQDLHDDSRHPDLVVIAYPDYLSQARELAGFHHDTQGLDTMVVTPGEVYNEFSSGRQDLSAIRDFMRMFYVRAGSDTSLMPKYLLLFGDASFDYRSIMFQGDKNTNRVPNYESVNSWANASSYGTDDYLGFLDDSEGGNIEDASEKLDIGIGRLPVNDAAEASDMVDKIMHYKSTASLGSWRNVMCFVADDEDYDTHESDAENISSYVNTNYPVYNINKIYLDAYQQVPGAGGQRYPDVNNAINTQMFTGTLIMNYIGHGNEQNWAQERVLEVKDINNWTNYGKLALFVTATCSFSRYDNPSLTSAGELTLLNAQGGAIGLVTTVRLVYAAANYDLNFNFMKNILKPLDGVMPLSMPTVGEALRLGKNAVTSDAVNNRKFILLGDPAVVLDYPQFRIATTTVNGHPIATYTDTLKALEKVTIQGEVTDEDGAKLNSFNGIVYPAVYDKPVTVNTLVNDPTYTGVGYGPSLPFSFPLQKNAIYKGKASVVNGDFSFTFIVPKDISYSFGNGKLSYYADDGNVDAAGYSFDVIVGGTADSIALDDAGPDVNVYMNDIHFVFGGLTDQSPLLLVKLVDSSGINTVGNSVGHDITGTLDDDEQSQIKLNDYYEADLDSYQSGTVQYPLSDLASGRHSMTVKAWDVYNNSSEGYTEFVVAESAKLALDHVLNYPNPFTTHTSFWFEHNRPGDVLDVKIEIFTVSGKRIKTIQQQVSTEGFRVDNIDWDGLDDFGDPIGRGVYVYKLSVRAESDNAKASEFQKLVILR